MLFYFSYNKNDNIEIFKMINLLNWSGILNVWRRSHGFRQWLIRCAEVRTMTGFNLLSQALSFYLLDNWTVTFCVYNHLQQCERSPRPYWKYYHVSPLRQPAAFKFVIMNQYEPFSSPHPPVPPETTVLQLDDFNQHFPDENWVFHESGRFPAVFVERIPDIFN